MYSVRECDFEELGRGVLIKFIRETSEEELEQGYFDDWISSELEQVAVARFARLSPKEQEKWCKEFGFEDRDIAGQEPEEKNEDIVDTEPSRDVPLTLSQAVQEYYTHKRELCFAYYEVHKKLCHFASAGENDRRSDTELMNVSLLNLKKDLERIEYNLGIMQKLAVVFTIEELTGGKQ